MLPESAVDSVSVFGRNSLEGGASWASSLFLVVDEMRAVIFNFPLVLYQHLDCYFPFREDADTGYWSSCNAEMIRKWEKQNSDS